MSEEKKNNHTLLKIAGVTAAAAAAGYAGFGYLVFRNAFDLQGSKAYAGRSQKRIPTGFGEKNEWFAHSVRDDEFLDSYDGLKLHALRITNHPEDHKWIIILHGIANYSAGMMDHLYEADHRGYNILAVDARGCGMSEGKYTGLGWSEHYDLINWINFIVNLDAEAKIALYGVDTGAAAIMNAVGDYIPSNVKCAVEDGGFSEIREEILYEIRKHCKVDGKIFLPSIDFYVKQFLHFSMNDISTKHQLKEGNIPMFFVHGAEDEVVPTSMLFDNYYAYAGEKDLWNVEGAGFGETAKADGYFDRIYSFIDKYTK